MTDNVNHPKHYNSHPSGVECVDVNEHFMYADAVGTLLAEHFPRTWEIFSGAS